jgi:hypothetical protein
MSLFGGLICGFGGLHSSAFLSPVALARRPFAVEHVLPSETAPTLVRGRSIQRLNTDNRDTPHMEIRRPRLSDVVPPNSIGQNLFRQIDAP